MSCGVLSLDKKLHTQTVHERIKRYQGKHNKIEEMCDESTFLAWEKNQKYFVKTEITESQISTSK